MNRRKVIITCAVTGAVHTPSMSPYLPITAEQISTSAIEAAQAGAAIVHLHARDPKTGQPDQAPERFAPIVAAVRGTGHGSSSSATTSGTSTHWRTSPSAVS